MENITIQADITKIDKKQRIVEGYATTTSVDRDEQAMDAEFLQRAFPDWADKYGNIRYMHKPQVVGKLIQRSEWDGNGFYITAKISDPQAWGQIERGELNGFSIGVKNAKLVPDTMARKGKIVDGEIIETSVVDVPSNRDSDFTLIKTATFDVAKGAWSDNEMDNIMCAGLVNGIAESDIDAYKRYYSDKERKEMDESDFAGPHRSFPIQTQDDVDNAARLIGHATDPDAVKRRIIEIAHRKGFSIPDAWKEDAHKDVTLDSGLQGHNLEGQKEDKTTVSDENKTVDVDSTEDVVKAAEVTTETVDEEKDDKVEKAADASSTVFEQLLNRLEEINAKIEALAGQTDQDKDGDIDTSEELDEEREGLTNPKPEIDPNKAEVAKTTETKVEIGDEIRELVKTLVVEQVAIFMQQNTDVQKTLVADEAKSLVADVEKRFDELNDSVTKFTERLETVEQMATPAKGSVMAIEREIRKTSEADALEVVQKFATQLPEEAQKELFKHVYSNQFANGGNQS